MHGQVPLAFAPLWVVALVRDFGFADAAASTSLVTLTASVVAAEATGEVHVGWLGSLPSCVDTLSDVEVGRGGVLASPLGTDGVVASEKATVHVYYSIVGKFGSLVVGFQTTKLKSANIYMYI